jgi:SAM-dependent methyltransferase
MGKSNETYDKYWQSGSHVTLEWTKDFFNESAGPLIGKKRVLDYGCGLGYSYQRQLSQSVKEYLAADVSIVALKDAESKGFQTVKIADNGTVDLPDGTCDGAVCSEVFEHLWDPLAAAKELNRILSPGGVLMVTVPNFGYLAWRFLAFLRAQVPLEPESKENRYRGVHIRFFSQLMLIRLLRDAGFREIKIYGWCGGSIWDVFIATGKFSIITTWAHRFLPSALHFTFLARIWPNVFAQRLRAVAVK